MIEIGDFGNKKGHQKNSQPCVVKFWADSVDPNKLAYKCTFMPS